MHIEKLKLKQGGECGYLIKKDDQEVGSFILAEQEKGVSRLRQLHVAGDVSKAGILYVFELIQDYVKEEDVHELQVESHSKDLNHLLAHQQFECNDEKGQLWIYKVNNDQRG
ncbi:hypothetical protein MUO14_08585 [Halobacillus shinanisalinarum]|uniref:N-acetyltransferase domain-containing protein n=1 Tax=Halobacillus shinanisalinarum TaxID=2932258 RepID=A0ABY4H5V5_9BACI|nr:hypothetical protein [Halobacillus shinanisalinarum]UOQ94967.1 hypothetical protein MUO14_08585 [Halobacillus shinanisalinarum]